MLRQRVRTAIKQAQGEEDGRRGPKEAKDQKRKDGQVFYQEIP